MPAKGYHQSEAAKMAISLARKRRSAEGYILSWHCMPKVISQDHKKSLWASKNGFKLIRCGAEEILDKKFNICEILRVD